MEKKGIDVSNWQGDINWQDVKNSGIEFAIIRTGYGRGGEEQIDNKFIENIKNAKSAGIKVGAYHYSYAESPEDAITEANFCLSIIKRAGISLDLPVYFDIEDSSIANKHDKSIRTQMCINFCTEIEKAGYWAGVYANLNWFENYLNKDELASRYTLWLAQYNDTKDMDADIWQYSSKGSVNGIGTAVDMNIMYRDLPAEISGNGQGQSPSHEESKPTEEFSYYRIQSGDTLSGIAAKFNTTYQYLASINGIENPNLIYAGQTIKVPTGGNTSNYKTYTVQSGDTLSGIAAKYGTTYQKIASDNGISNPNLIYPGQVLTIK